MKSGRTTKRIISCCASSTSSARGRRTGTSSARRLHTPPPIIAAMWERHRFAMASVSQCSHSSPPSVSSAARIPIGPCVPAPLARRSTTARGARSSSSSSVASRSGRQRTLQSPGEKLSIPSPIETQQWPQLRGASVPVSCTCSHCVRPPPTIGQPPLIAALTRKGCRQRIRLVTTAASEMAWSSRSRRCAVECATRSISTSGFVAPPLQSSSPAMRIRAESGSRHSPSAAMWASAADVSRSHTEGSVGGRMAMRAVSPTNVKPWYSGSVPGSLSASDSIRISSNMTLTQCGSNVERGATDCCRFSAGGGGAAVAPSVGEAPSEAAEAPPRRCCEKLWRSSSSCEVRSSTIRRDVACTGAAGGASPSPSPSPSGGAASSSMYGSTSTSRKGGSYQRICRLGTEIAMCTGAYSRVRGS